MTNNKYLVFVDTDARVDRLNINVDINDLPFIYSATTGEKLLCAEDWKSGKIFYFKDRDNPNPYETVTEYICSILPKDVYISLMYYLIILDKDNQLQIDDFEKKYVSLVSKDLRRLIIKTIRNDFSLNPWLMDHFVCRLLCRFGNEPIDFMMRRIKEAYAKRKRHSSKKEEILTGSDIRIIYNHKRNEIVTVFMPRIIDQSKRRY